MMAPVLVRWLLCPLRIISVSDSSGVCNASRVCIGSKSTFLSKSFVSFSGKVVTVM